MSGAKCHSPSQKGSQRLKVGAKFTVKHSLSNFVRVVECSGFSDMLTINAVTVNNHAKIDSKKNKQTKGIKSHDMTIGSLACLSP